MEFLILGPLEVRKGADVVRLGAAKQRALLGVLLMHPNETVSTVRLVDALWGELPPATADKLVPGYVHALRRRLGDDVLETQPPGYRLNLESRSLDLVEFERLLDSARVAPLSQSVELRRRALALWRGPPLADVALEGSERNALTRLSELRLATQIEQIDGELELGRHAKLIGELEALVAEHPYQERLRAQLMLALYRSGRQADSLQTYRDLRRVLRDELGLEPSKELRELEARILRQDETLSSYGPRPVARAPERFERPSTDTALPVNREPIRRVSRRAAVALATIVALLTIAVTAAVVLIRGEDGASITAPANSVALIDPATNTVVATLPTGDRPGPVAEGADSIWIGNLDDRTLTRVDLATRTVSRTISLSATPDAVAFGANAVWVVNGRLGTLNRVDPRFDSVSDPVQLAHRSVNWVGGGVDASARAVWAVFGDSTLARVNATSLQPAGEAEAGVGPSAIAVGFDSVWVVVSSGAKVQRFRPRTFEEGPIDELPVGRDPRGIAIGEGAVWVANRADDSVSRIDPSLGDFSSGQPLQVGRGPTAVATGAGAVWVSNTDAGTVTRIDPASNEVVETIEIGNAPAGIVVARGLVWVAIQAP